MVGCSESRDHERVAVHSSLRLKSASLVLPESGTIKLRVKTGKYRTTLFPQSVNVKRGSITFQGANGYIRLATNNCTVIKSVSLDSEVRIQMIPGTQHVRFHLTQQPFRMSINWSTTPTLSEYCELNKCSYVDFCPNLKTSTDGAYFDVDIPIQKSADFIGEVTDWVIISNWK